MGRGRRRMTCAVAVVVGLLGLGSSMVGLAPEAGAASPTWQSRTIPWTKAGPVQATVNGVSCAAVRKCVAVGSAALPDSTGATGAFVANLVQGQWVQGLLPLPAGAVDASLSGVSCPTATTCVGVGSYGLSSDGSTVDHALVETFADGTWTPLIGLDPAGATTATLTGVSCTGLNACKASGTAEATTGPGPYAFVSSLAGSAWTAVTPALPSGVTSDSFASISCTSTNHCVAVGDTDLDEALMDVDVRGVWTATLASAVSDSTLASVSCSVSGVCVAVGDDGGADAGFAEQLSGTKWKLDTSLPSAAVLTSVSCITTSLTCTAWGNGPVVESLSSGTWSQEATSGLSSYVISGIVGSCVSAASCQAFGAAGPGFIKAVAVLREADGTWTSVDLPGPPLAALAQVACSTVACAGVGTYYDASGQEYTAILDLQGGRWMQVAYPLPIDYLYYPSISCAVKTCVVVSGQSAAVSTNGTTWTVHSLPTPTGFDTDGGFFDADAVSCWSASGCVAVGNPSGSGDGLFEETFLHGKWTGIQLPSTLGSGTLAGISCTSATSCRAVGAGGPGGIESLIETLRGTTWTEDVLPPATGATYGGLAGISCTSDNHCVAVGSWYPSYGGDGNPLSLALSAGNWTQTEVSVPGTIGGFSSVACPTRGICYATIDGQAMRLAGGVWSAVTVPVPPGASDQVLSSVRCVTAAWCVLAGNDLGPAPSGEAQESPMIATLGAPVPVITSADSATATVGVPASVTLRATSIPVASVSVTGTLPAGFKLVEHLDGTATLKGTATTAERGTYSLTVVADNGVGAPAAQSFTLTVS